ncbi:hypothetical protein A0H81_13733 [Grifola frondosa]|uniref:Uncharacterized protein n=1 Tax=Grifola frondosa TaxID=5627 RepID=A0A1C7LPI4_GRIFR|nr:hypothetical protein A0H81_13733 [Grifola frondosa]
MEEIGNIKMTNEEIGRLREEMRRFHDLEQSHILELKKDTLELKKDTLELKKDTLELKKDMLELKKDQLEFKQRFRKLQGTVDQHSAILAQHHRHVLLDMGREKILAICNHRSWCELQCEYGDMLIPRVQEMLLQEGMPLSAESISAIDRGVVCDGALMLHMHQHEQLFTVL